VGGGSCVTTAGKVRVPKDNKGKDPTQPSKLRARKPFGEGGKRGQSQGGEEHHADIGTNDRAKLGNTENGAKKWSGHQTLRTPGEVEVSLLKQTHRKEKKIETSFVSQVYKTSKDLPGRPGSRRLQGTGKSYKKRRAPMSLFHCAKGLLEPGRCL